MIERDSKNDDHKYELDKEKIKAENNEKMRTIETSSTLAIETLKSNTQKEIQKMKDESEDKKGEREFKKKQLELEYAYKKNLINLYHIHTHLEKIKKRIKKIVKKH